MTYKYEAVYYLQENFNAIWDRLPIDYKAQITKVVSESHFQNAINAIAALFQQKIGYVVLLLSDRCVESPVAQPQFTDQGQIVLYGHEEAPLVKMKEGGYMVYECYDSEDRLVASVIGGGEDGKDAIAVFYDEAL